MLQAKLIQQGDVKRTLISAVQASIRLVRKETKEFSRSNGPCNTQLRTAKHMSDLEAASLLVPALHSARCHREIDYFSNFAGVVAYDYHCCAGGDCCPLRKTRSQLLPKLREITELFKGVKLQDFARELDMPHSDW